MLEVVLLQIDEGRPAVARLGQQVELRRSARVSKNTLPVFHVTPLSTSVWPTPSRSMISSVRLDQQMARLPSDRLLFLSMTTLR